MSENGSRTTLSRLRYGWVGALLAGLVALLPLVAWAEGPLSGGTRLYIVEEPLGAFTVASFAAPNPPVTTDRLWVTAQIRDGGKAITDARVWVTVTHAESRASERLEATHDLAAVPLDYTAAFPVSEPGSYTVEIEMEHESGTGRVSYPVSVTEPMTRTIFLMMALPAVLIALVLIHRFVIRLPAPAAILAGDDQPLEP